MIRRYAGGLLLASRGSGQRRPGERGNYTYHLHTNHVTSSYARGLLLASRGSGQRGPIGQVNYTEYLHMSHVMASYAGGLLLASSHRGRNYTNTQICNQGHNKKWTDLNHHPDAMYKLASISVPRRIDYHAKDTHCQYGSLPNTIMKYFITSIQIIEGKLYEILFP